MDHGEVGLYGRSVQGLVGEEQVIPPEAAITLPRSTEESIALVRGCDTDCVTQRYSIIHLEKEYCIDKKDFYCVQVTRKSTLSIFFLEKRYVPKID